MIAQLLDLAGPDASVIATSSRPWASATFTGARHSVVMKLHGADHAGRASRLARRLPDAEFSISGHIVADACVDDRAGNPAGDRPMAQADETMLHLSVLTIEDW
ncbi:MAG: hypothetical protein AB7E05_08890 [Sphingobium sp.]